MIIKAFSEYIKTFNSEIPSLLLLTRWLREILSKNPENNVEKIIHNEIGILKNNRGVFLLIGKTKSGKVLIEALHEFALSYDQHKFSKWIHKIKASDFKED
jgi:hypothetical protein